METEIVLAYANKSTDYEWTLLAKFYRSDMLLAKNTIRKYAITDMVNSALALFIVNADGIHFSEKKPFCIYNRHVLVENAKIGAAVGGLIDSRESDWF
jgi:hypothetical protein